ncbi:hypothetical protein ISG27_12710 [Burkholderia pseudomallei]|nr:hypothetical protein [Burkholderia pseudomallei]MBF3975031.1 hypothetical protein [Burkholderia pseudomallei]
MYREWIDIADELPAKRPQSSFSAHVIVWVEYLGIGCWTGDRFDHISGTWEIHGGDEDWRVTHWMHGPDSPHDPS